MTWHLKNRKLEEKIIGIDADFSERLNQLCEKWDSNKDGDLYEYMQFSVPFFHGDRLHGEVIFSGDEVEKVDEYNPKDWNSFPEVIPPENVWMRLEIKANDSKHISREVAFSTMANGAISGVPFSLISPMNCVSAPGRIKNDER